MVVRVVAVLWGNFSSDAWMCGCEGGCVVVGGEHRVQGRYIYTTCKQNALQCGLGPLLQFILLSSKSNKEKTNSKIGVPMSALLYSSHEADIDWILLSFKHYPVCFKVLCSIAETRYLHIYICIIIQICMWGSDNFHYFFSVRKIWRILIYCTFIMTNQ